jgi:photosystem II stability/assembly factor-like uncharacterized protein
MMLLAASLFLVVQESVTWTRVPLVTAEMQKAGLMGGEGAQWPRGLTINPDGKTMFLAIDVGGIYRSLDSGKTWHPANVGFTPRGCANVLSDPRNSDRVIAIGANSSTMDWHGIYLSTNRGASWKSVLPVRMGGLEEVREQLAFDPSTYDAKLQKTKVAYWSRIRHDKPNWGETIEHPALYRSADGGENWSEIKDSAPYAGGIIRTSKYAPGFLFAGNEKGLHVSADQGNRWTTVEKSVVTGLDTAGRFFYVTTEKGVRRYVFTDQGRLQRDQELTNPAPISYVPRNIKVSPLDPNALVLWTEPVPNNWDWRRYASKDGGRTWTQSKLLSENCFLPSNARQGIFAWHPTEENHVFSLGGDWPTLSRDGGETYRWSADGYNAVLIGGSFQFCQQDPQTMFFGSQDYDGAVTEDTGRTWRYVSPSGNGWGGFCYGGYALNSKTLWVGNAPGWGGPRGLRVSNDGGKTWEDKKLEFQGKDISNGSPKNPKLGFASDLRTADGGKTWSRMTGCDGVTTFKANGDPVGIKKVKDKEWAVVTSFDQGLTWKQEATFGQEVFDVAWDAKGQRYLVATLQLFELKGGIPKVLETPKDQLGNQWLKTVAVDPQDPATIYVGHNANIYSVSNAVCRSRDGGKTWQVLTRNQPLNEKDLDGGRETFWIRVHPVTREAWCATSCYGTWKVK